MGRVDRIVGVSLCEVHSSIDERGTSAQVVFPKDWVPKRLYTVTNRETHTLRGLHFQRPGTYKTVLCTSGIVYDVLVDLRPHFGTEYDWTSVSLSPGTAIVVPPGVAHGYLTLTAGASLTYLIEGERSDDTGLRWDDPEIGVEWPAEPKIISQRDQNWSYL